MIAEITFRNFYSFRDKTTFSFEADNDHELEQFHVVEVQPGVRLLKLGIIYGANASGKSNILKVWSFFRDFFESRKVLGKKESINYQPFKLNTKSEKETSEFSLTFYVEDEPADSYTKYVYSLVLQENKVISEVLHAYFTSQPAVIFDRMLDDGISVVKFGSKIKVSHLIREEINLKCLPNISLFSAYSRVNARIPELDKVARYLNRKLNFSVFISRNSMLGYRSMPLMVNQKEKVLEFIQEADFNITDISRNKEAKKSLGMYIHSPNLYTHKVFDENENAAYYDFPDSMESEGTLQTLRLANYIYRTIRDRGFLAVDEIESSLHPKLIEFLLIKFLKESTTEQLLFTTHYDGLLAEEDIIRKDNIWFTAKNKEGVSELYPLTDFKGLGRVSSLQKAYKVGKFGGIPNI